MNIYDPVHIAQALIRCPSITPFEGGALTFLEEVLKQHKFDVNRITFGEQGTQKVENLYARFGNHGPNLCFAGHTDVVPPGNEQNWSYPPFAAEINNGYLYGRGAADMKGGIACFIAAAARTLNAKGKLPGSISLLITGDEEGPAINGTAKMLDWLHSHEESLDGCIVGEPTCANHLGDTVKIGRRGSLTAYLTVLGAQGHVAYPQYADNPIPKLMRIADRIANIELDTGNDSFEPSNLEITVISTSNKVSNVIPSEAEMTFNVRYNNNWSRNSIENCLADLCHKESEEIGANINLTFSSTAEAFLTKPGSLVNATKDAVKQVTGCVPELSTSGGTSDARFIQACCPVVEFGHINKTIHQIDERVAINDIYRLTSVYEHIINLYFGNKLRLNVY
ncbi:MAG: succinyl-diaminopimelate desuccinylase [Hyphomicrobiaceae bacterium]|nr:succinyl-diaminopimelate desuccinylase [Hyphomicrobiaceae bacterium]